MMYHQKKSKRKYQLQKKKEEDKRRVGLQELSLERLLKTRDFEGALNVLQYYDINNIPKEKRILDHGKYEAKPWIIYCYFHGRKYEECLEEIENFIVFLEAHLKNGTLIYKDYGSEYTLDDYKLFKALCLYALGDLECREIALHCQPSPLRTRLLYHIAEKQKEEMEVQIRHAEIQDHDDDVANHMTVAAMMVSRGEFQNAADLFKNILLKPEHKHYHALHYFIALCYYQIDHPNRSQHILSNYIKQVPDSFGALNLAASNVFKLLNGLQKQNNKQSEDLENFSYPLSYLDEIELSSSGSLGEMEQAVIEHNRIVFKQSRNGDAETTFRQTLDMLQESLWNLSIYYTHHEKYREAYQLVKEKQPVYIMDTVIKATVYMCIVLEQQQQQKLMIDPETWLKDDVLEELLGEAKHYFQLIGNAPCECDTVLGRQCMATYLFLSEKYNEMLIYLQSLESYVPFHPVFHWNLSIAYLKTNQFSKALAHLEKIKGFVVFFNPKMASEPPSQQIENSEYLKHWFYCKLKSDFKRDEIWTIFHSIEQSDILPPSFSLYLLRMIANMCYEGKHYFCSLEAFQLLVSRSDSPDESLLRGRRGAAMGFVQAAVILASTSSPIDERFARIMSTSLDEHLKRKYAKGLQQMLMWLAPSNPSLSPSSTTYMYTQLSSWYQSSIYCNIL